MDLKISKQDKGGLKLNATSSVLTKNLPSEPEAGAHRYICSGEKACTTEASVQGPVRIL